jgi:tetratricopeptide (TPR) repeat protein
MSLFGFGRASEPSAPLPIPRATRTWPKAQPRHAPSYAAPADEPKAAPAPAKPVLAPAAETKPSFEPQKAAPPPVNSASVKPALTPAAIRAAVAPAIAAAAPAPAVRRPDPVFFVARAAAKQARGDHDGAVEDFGRAIEADPLCVTAWAGRAVSLEARGELEAARRDYATSIKIELQGEISRQRESGPSLDVRA